jgi:hypothetical protein
MSGNYKKEVTGTEKTHYVYEKYIIIKFNITLDVKEKINGLAYRSINVVQNET